MGTLITPLADPELTLPVNTNKAKALFKKDSKQGGGEASNSHS